MKEKLSDKIIKVYLNRKLKNVGKVEIQHGNIICRVDMNEVKKYFSDSEGIFLDLENISTRLNWTKLGYNRNIIYVFEDVIIYDNLKIMAPSANVIFKNCDLSYDVDIIEADGVEFTGDITSKLYSLKKRSKLSGKVQKLNFCVANLNSYADVMFESNSTRITNSTINLGNFKIVGNSLDVIYSKINVGELELELSSLNSDDSEFKASEIAKVNVDESMDIDAIKSKKLIVDGQEFISIEDVVEGEKAKRNLLTTLKMFSSECKRIGIPETEKVEKANQMIKKM